MRKTDLYTKSMLTIIAVCLIILCVQGARWSRIETVHADGPQQVVISGFVLEDTKGKQTVIKLGDGTLWGYANGIPVVTQQPR